MIKENTRQFPFLVYDGEDALAGLRCVGCQICEKECPPQCIYIEKSKHRFTNFPSTNELHCFGSRSSDWRNN